MPPDRGILHSESKTCGPTEHKVAETGSKSVPSQSLEMTVSGLQVTRGDSEWSSRSLGMTASRTIFIFTS